MSKSRTLEQRHSVSEGIVKAGEVIEIRNHAALTLNDRRILNLLIENAGIGIAGDEVHRIPIAKLRGPNHKGSERVKDSIVRLMTTLVEVPTKDSKGNRATRRMTLLAETTTTDDEDNPAGEVMYTFSHGMREIIQKSRYWGRIKAHIMFAFSSKYALTLYEMICLRANLQVNEQEFSLEEFRRLLGVADGSLTGFPQLKQKVVTPAVEEVNGLSDFNVTITPLREGGRERGTLKGFRVEWERKSSEEWFSVLDELMRSRVGRKARITGTVERPTLTLIKSA